MKPLHALTIRDSTKLGFLSWYILLHSEQGKMNSEDSNRSYLPRVNNKWRLDCISNRNTATTFLASDGSMRSESLFKLKWKYDFIDFIYYNNVSSRYILHYNVKGGNLQRPDDNNITVLLVETSTPNTQHLSPTPLSHKTSGTVA